MTDAIAIHRTYESGDLEALKTALGDPPDFPNCRGPQGAGEIVLETPSTTARLASYERFSISASSRITGTMTVSHR